MQDVAAEDISHAAGHERARLTAAAVAVVLAAIVGGLLAIWSYTAQQQVSAGTVSLSVSPFHKGSLDVYVPVVDWGVRFAGVRAPARLKVEVQSVDRTAAEKMVRGGLPATRTVRADARDAVASYLRELALLASCSRRAGCRRRRTTPTAATSPPRCVWWRTRRGPPARSARSSTASCSAWRGS